MPDTRNIAWPPPPEDRNLLLPHIPGTRANTIAINESVPWPTVKPTESQKNLLFGLAGIVSPSIAAKTKFPVNLPKHPEFLDAVKNTPGAEITEQGLKLNAIRYQKPEQAGEESVRGGVMYLLNPKDKNLTYYRTNKFGYGGSDKISGETMVKNPLVVKGATGGKVGEMAFDTINGKGSYSAMRKEALDATGIYFYGRWTPEQRISAVENFLKKYAPDRVDMASEIVRVSTKNNTLPYALQEMAVHNSAYKAGYDSILGYSKRRDGSHFLSELFDLREKGYPSAEGGSTLYEGLVKD